jgi:hypothetical protein
LKEIRVYFIFGTGYASGNGGQVKVQVRTDDESNGHFPSDQVLGSAMVTDPTSHNFRTIQFIQSIPIEEGRLYHLVYSNPAPDPTQDYVSIDDLYQAAGTPNMQPTIPDTDFAVVWKDRSDSPWAVNYHHTPIVDIRYHDGFVQGQGYMDALIESLALPLQGTRMVRELITVQGTDQLVTHISARLRNVEGDGQAIVRLERGDGTLIEEGSLSVTSGSYTWATYQFQNAHRLLAGQTYAVVLGAPSGNRLQTFPMQQGTSYGFQTPTIFVDGHAEYFDGSAWKEVRSSSDFDFQLYFTTAGR